MRQNSAANEKKHRTELHRLFCICKASGKLLMKTWSNWAIHANWLFSIIFSLHFSLNGHKSKFAQCWFDVFTSVQIFLHSFEWTSCSAQDQCAIIIDLKITIFYWNSRGKRSIACSNNWECMIRVEKQVWLNYQFLHSYRLLFNIVEKLGLLNHVFELILHLTERTRSSTAIHWILT